MGFFILLTLNLLFAGTPAFFKLASHELSPLNFVWLRHTTALIWLAPLAFYLGVPRMPLADWLRVAAAAACVFSGASLMQAFAMQHATASSGAMIVAMEPVLMMCFSVFFLHERYTGRSGLGFLLAFGGFLLLSWGQGMLQFEGNALYLLAVVCEAIYPVLIVPLIKRYQAPHIVFYCLLCASLFLLPFQNVEILNTFASLSWKGWGSIAYLGIACSGTASVLWLYAMQRMQVSTVVVSWFLQPLWGNLLAIWLLSETLTLNTYFGGSMIIGAIVLLCWKSAPTTVPADQTADNVIPLHRPPLTPVRIVPHLHNSHRMHDGLGVTPPHYDRRSIKKLAYRLPHSRAALLAYHRPPRRHNHTVLRDSA